ncbi:MAG: lipoprotein-releasing ABC transporter permease subunit [Pseudomonadales bacterium]
MFRPLSVYIGARYTRARRRNQFVSFISMLSLLGLTLGVAVLIVVISVMNGFEAEIRNRTLSAIPHLTVEQASGLDIAAIQSLREQLSTDPEVIGVAPYVAGKAMLGVSGLVRGVQVTGVDPDQEAAVADLQYQMVGGALSELRSGEFGVLIGSVTANHLGLSLGDKLSLTLPQIAVTPLGIFPRVKQFSVVGVFDVGAEIDSSTIFIHINDASKLYQKGSNVDGLRVKLNELFRAPNLRQHWQVQLGDEFDVRDWSQSQGGLFQAIAMEKRVMGLLLMIVVVVAAFNIVSIVVMMVADKRAAIAVLRTMGMRARSVVAIFLTQGSLIGLLGVTAGTVIGVLIALNVSDIVAAIESAFSQQLFDPSVFQIVHMPSLVRLSDVLLISGASFALSVLAALYPAWKASSIEAAEVLRYE